MDQVFEASVRSKIAKLEHELEVERLRLAACGCAALGYFNGCADEYKSASLEDVLRLCEQLASVIAERDELVEALKQFAECDLNDGNCASLEVATRRIRSLAQTALAKLGAGGTGEK